jgi:hypothetical protein
MADVEKLRKKKAAAAAASGEGGGGGGAKKSSSPVPTARHKSSATTTTTHYSCSKSPIPQDRSAGAGDWRVLLDASKLVGTAPLDLGAHPGVDMVCMSFYKVRPHSQLKSVRLKLSTVKVCLP